MNSNADTDTEQLQSNIYFRHYVNSIIDKVNAINTQIEQMKVYLAKYQVKPNEDKVMHDKIAAILELQESPAFIAILRKDDK
ncbi:hypothetical protein F-S17_0202 [Faustovirus]|nr:hypothetical protein F-S17_0202 [Faustovirus]